MALKIATVGAGSWGTALANVFADAGHESVIWGRDPEVIASINARHENSKYLPGRALSRGLTASADLASILAKADMIVCAVPTQKIRPVFGPLCEHLNGKIIVNSAKGLEIGSHMRVSEVFASLNPTTRYAVLSGPSFAKEVVEQQPTAVTIASTDRDLAVEIQQEIATPYFRAYTTQDVVGVEFAGALKNVVALATGIVRGRKLGYNAQAAVINRGMAEIVRAGRKLGADPATFLGLAGMGDLVLTCTGPLSRNLQAGILIGEGKQLDQIIQTLGGVAEGVFTAQSAYELATARGIDMPILREIHGILYEGKTPESAVASLMGRDLREETE
jgi:glycerol-3-phosphate dehydrogenase (NAD(P)+)